MVNTRALFSMFDGTALKDRFAPWSAIFLVLTSVAFTGCANFRRLGRDLEFMDKTVMITAQVTNASAYSNIYGFVIEWDRKNNKVLSTDFTKVGELGVFGFAVKHTDNQYVAAFSDLNGNGLYDPSEPSWIYSDTNGNPVSVTADPTTGNARTSGSLSVLHQAPPGLVEAARKYRGARTIEEAATGWRIPFELGTLANLDDPKFSSERGARGLWEPASFPMETGVGIFFLEKYDPNRIPVLFVYGAAGSPQDWRRFFEKIDRRKYQPWFYHYPTGRRLEELGGLLNRGVKLLQAHYGFQRMDVVAHSMGGLVTRSFILTNLAAGNRYIDKYVTISTPWAGHPFAALGVKHAPSVVPAWLDLQPDSPFLRQLFQHQLHGRINHLLLYSTKASNSLWLPKENDGTVSVASETAAAAERDATEVRGFAEDHVSILSNDDVIQLVFKFLDGN